MTPCPHHHCPRHHMVFGLSFVITPNLSLQLAARLPLILRPSTSFYPEPYSPKYVGEYEGRVTNFSSPFLWGAARSLCASTGFASATTLVLEILQVVSRRAKHEGKANEGGLKG
jgi:hypothetical protein